MNNMSIKISVVIITKNEIDRISICLQSLHALTDDIIVVDSRSNDGTAEKAKELGAQVFDTSWQGYGPTKNFGHQKAKYDWILSLDADEALSKELLEEISEMKLNPGCIYAIDRQNFYLGKAIKYSGWSPDWVLRIFNKNEVKWNENLVHEKLILPERNHIIKLKGKLFHNSYRSLEDHRTKIEKYAILRAQTWIANAKSPGIPKRFLGPIWKGFKSFILKLGFLDGKAGWTIAKMNIYLVKRQIYHFDNLKSPRS
jgi:glycosyltransferase involved in cell wall biosynthesis